MSGRPCRRHRPGQATLELVKASPETQVRLLELADLDAELGRIDHRRRGLPEVAEVNRIDARDAQLRDAIIAAETSEKDLAREQAKAEADVDQVRTRSVRDRERLDAGQVSSPRELEVLQSEIASLLRRQSELEDVVLDVMERREAAQASRDSLTAERTELAARRLTVAARRDEALGELGEQSEKAADRRGRRRRPGARGPARSLRADAGPARRGRGRPARRPMRRLPPDPEHRGPEPDPGRGRRRGAALRGVPPDPGSHPRIGAVTTRCRAA